MKLSKRKLIKMLTDKGIPVSRDERKDINTLLTICSVNGIDVGDDVPRGTTENNDAHQEADDNNDTPKANEQVENANEQVEDAQIKDSKEDIFARMRSSSTVDDDDDNNIFGRDENVDNEIKVKQKRGRKSKPQADIFHVEGYMLLMVIDLALPTGISYLFNLFEKDKSKQIKPNDIAMTDQQKEIMLPIADKAAEALTLKLNPITAFFIMGSLMYANNIYLHSQLKK